MESLIFMGSSIWCNSYNIYRSQSLITSINNSVTFIGNTISTEATDTIITNGTYYYAITAVGPIGESQPVELSKYLGRNPAPNNCHSWSPGFKFNSGKCKFQRIYYTIMDDNSRCRILQSLSIHQYDYIAQ